MDNVAGKLSGRATWGIYLLNFCSHFFSLLLCVQLQLLLGLVHVPLHSFPVNCNVSGVISDLKRTKITLRSDLWRFRGSAHEISEAQGWAAGCEKSDPSCLFVMIRLRAHSLFSLSFLFLFYFSLFLMFVSARFPKMSPDTQKSRNPRTISSLFCVYLNTAIISI